jgi:hypothetical protein
MITSPSRLAHRKPIPKYMIVSITNASGSALAASAWSGEGLSGT